MYFYWQAGCGLYLRERYNLGGVRVTGSSAGALTAVLLANDVDFVRATDKAIEVAHEADVSALLRRAVFAACACG